jgi:hypothetical protein
MKFTGAELFAIVCARQQGRESKSTPSIRATNEARARCSLGLRKIRKTSSDHDTKRDLASLNRLPAEG